MSTHKTLEIGRMSPDCGPDCAMSADCRKELYQDHPQGWCGKSEEAHSVMKEDLAGRKLPSGKFGVNAAWWWVGSWCWP